MNHDPTNPPNPADARALTARLADWRAFAAAAGATLATVSSADASIIYANPNVDVKFTTAAPNAANAPASGRFTIGGGHETAFIRAGSYDGNPANFVAVRGGLGVFVVSNGTSAARAALNFAPGKTVAGAFQQASGYLRIVENNQHGFGYFATGKTGIAGFQLPNGDYGWMKVEVIDRNNDGFPDELEVLSDAYNTVPGAPILAGGGAPGGAVPEPSTTALALLAAGSAGVLAWRKRRTAARTGDPAALTSPDAARILCA